MVVGNAAVGARRWFGRIACIKPWGMGKWEAGGGAVVMPGRAKMSALLTSVWF